MKTRQGLVQGFRSRYKDNEYANPAVSSFLSCDQFNQSGLVWWMAK